MEPLTISTIVGFAAAGAIVVYTAHQNERMSRILRVVGTALVALAASVFLSRQIALPINIVLLASVFFRRFPQLPALPLMGRQPEQPPVIRVEPAVAAAAAPAGGGAWPYRHDLVPPRAAPAPALDHPGRAPDPRPGIQAGLHEPERAAYGNGEFDLLARRVDALAGRVPFGNPPLFLGDQGYRYPQPRREPDPDPSRTPFGIGVAVHAADDLARRSIPQRVAPPVAEPDRRPEVRPGPGRGMHDPARAPHGTGEVNGFDSRSPMRRTPTAGVDSDGDGARAPSILRRAPTPIPHPQPERAQQRGFEYPIAHRAPPRVPDRGPSVV